MYVVKKVCIMICVSALMLFSACQSESAKTLPQPDGARNYLPVTDVLHEKTVTGTKDGVEEFLKLFGDFDSKNEGALTYGYEHSYKTCYNITPGKINQQMPDCKVFKFSESCLSVMQYGTELYVLGASFGGYGIVDMLLTDIDEDGEMELLYTYSWGSGIHRSHIAYFDFTEKTENLIEYVYLDHDMMIIEDTQAGLAVYHADLAYGDYDTSFVDYRISPGDFLCRPAFENGSVVCYNENGEELKN